MESRTEGREWDGSRVAIQLLAEGRSEVLSSPAQGFMLQRAQTLVLMAGPEMG